MPKTVTDNPMIAMMIKALGIDPSMIIGQAQQIGAAFQRLLAGQAQIIAGQAQIIAGQGEILATLSHHTDMLSTMQIAMGVAPPPDDAMALLIADESRKYMGRTIMGDTVQGAGSVAIAYVKLEELLKIREGVQLEVYKDSLGKLTVGIGHLVRDDDDLEEGDSITEEQCDAFFREDAKGAMDAAVGQMGMAGITDSQFLPWLASVNFQLGTRWTTIYTFTWNMVVAGNYLGAAEHIATLPWAHETPVRTNDFCAALRALPPKSGAIENTGAVAV